MEETNQELLTLTNSFEDDLAMLQTSESNE